MTWRSTLLILTAFLTAGAAFVLAPVLLDLTGLGEFAFVGQLCLMVLALSVLERIIAQPEPFLGQVSPPSPAPR